MEQFVQVFISGFFRRGLCVSQCRTGSDFRYYRLVNFAHGEYLMLAMYLPIDV